MTDADVREGIDDVVAMLTAWRADDMKLFTELVNQAERTALVCAIGTIHSAMERLARVMDVESDEYFRLFAIAMASDDFGWLDDVTE